MGQAFALNRAPVAWRRVWGTALTSALAFLFGWASGNVHWGAWAFLGGFTSFYVADQVYGERARVLGAAGLGMVAAMAAGSLPPVWWLTAASLGVLSSAATFTTGMRRVPLPAGFMFILVGCISAAQPRPVPRTAELLAVAGGAAAGWIIGMSGWLLRPHGPEQAHVRAAYRAVAQYVRGRRWGGGVGEGAPARPNEAARAVEEAIAACTAGSGRDPGLGRVLAGLARRSRALLYYAVAVSAETGQPPGPPWATCIEAAGDPTRQALPPVPAGAAVAGSQGPLSTRFREVVEDTLRAHRRGPSGVPARNAGRQSPTDASERIAPGRTPPPSPLVPYTSLRIGIAVAAAVCVAHFLGVSRPFWVPLTAAAVLQGETVEMFTRRAIQRVVGTVGGLLLAGVLISSIRPPVPMAMLLIVALQALMLVFIARNYAVAVGFMTAFAMLILHLSAPGVPPLAARLRDTLVGVVVALAAAHLLWPRVSSRRLPGALRGLVAATAAYLQGLATRTESGGRESGLDGRPAGPGVRSDGDAIGPAWAASAGSDAATLQAAVWRTDALARDAGAEVPASRTAAELRGPVAAAERLAYALLAAEHAGVDVPADGAAAAARVLQAWNGPEGAPPTGARVVPLPPSGRLWHPLARELAVVAAALPDLPGRRVRG